MGVAPRLTGEEGHDEERHGRPRREQEEQPPGRAIEVVHPPGPDGQGGQQDRELERPGEGDLRRHARAGGDLERGDELGDGLEAFNFLELSVMSSLPPAILFSINSNVFINSLHVSADATRGEFFREFECGF